MKNKSKIDIIFEKIPPFLSWTLILFPIWGGFFFPHITAYIVIVFNVFFLYKSVAFFVFFIISFRELRKSESIDWLSRLRELDNIDQSVNDLRHKLQALEQNSYDKVVDNEQTQKLWRRTPLILRKLAFNLSKNKARDFVNAEIARLQEIKNNGTNLDWKELHHVIIIPHWKEPLTVLRDTLENLKNSNFPTKKINVVLGAEKRDPEGYEKSMQLRNDYQAHFENIWISNHELQENEIVGKSSNMAWAGKHAKQEIDKLGWDLKKVLITSCDADSLVPKDYFANVTYKYVTLKDSEYKYFNAAMIFYANIWRLPFYARVKNSISSLYNISRLARPDKFTPFSTYSVSFWLIDQIGYWTPWVTPEDYHLFFKGLFHFPDKVSAIPVHQKIMADAAEGEGHWETIKNSYYQERRWSWGVSDDGWVLKQLLKTFLEGRLTLRALYKGLHVVFDHIMGIAASFIIVIGGNIPLLINRNFAGTVIGLNLPRVSQFMVRITIWFMLALIIIDHFLLKPKEPLKKGGFLRRSLRLLEWFVMPYVGFVLVTLPGIEAHTRLLFGKYLEYYLTKKK